MLTCTWSPESSKDGRLVSFAHSNIECLLCAVLNIKSRMKERELKTTRVKMDRMRPIAEGGRV